MKKFKIYFVFEFTDKPKGGVFQFTKALKDYCDNLGYVTKNPQEADIFYISASHCINKILEFKYKYPNKIFVHRIDGPIRLYNRMSDIRDDIVNLLNKKVADATIFQSQWSKKYSKKMGILDKQYETTILNAPNPDIFNSKDKIPFSKNRKVKLIATSWSSNWKKGFETYKWLDENLDFSKYEFTFVGNTPIKFNNIIYKEPMDSISLARELKQHDIFITASQKDPCSNSLIEAMHCGLPAIVLNDGGHPEIVGDGGETFNKNEEIIDKLEKIVKNYVMYQQKINLPTMDEVANKYLSFFESLLYIKKTQKISKIEKIMIETYFKYLKLKERIVLISNKYFGGI